MCDSLECSTKKLARRFVAPKLFPCENFFSLPEDLKRAHLSFLKTINRETSRRKKSKMFSEASGLVLLHQAYHPQRLHNGESSDCSINLSIKAGIGPADDASMARSITLSPDPHAECIRGHL
jgi:hypothetical protein